MKTRLARCSDMLRPRAKIKIISAVSMKARATMQMIAFCMRPNGSQRRKINLVVMKLGKNISGASRISAHRMPIRGTIIDTRSALNTNLIANTINA